VNGFASLAHAARHHRFVLLFVSLVAFFVLIAVAEALRGEAAFAELPHPVQSFAFCLLLVAGVGAVETTRQRLLIALSLSLPVVGLGVLSHLTHDPAWEFGSYLFSAAFLLYVIGVILRRIFRTTTITIDTVFASLCVYLLLAIVWALAYSVSAMLVPEPFVFTLDPAQTPDMRIARGNPGVVAYFSFATLTTLGYGDIVPTASLTRTLAALEAVVGQLYLTVLVARLVGLYSASVHSDEPLHHPPRR
jgi:voltage-gated potassium channel